MFTKRNAVLFSPFFIISINLIVAIISNRMIGKWSFMPIILIEWVLFMFFVLWFGGTDSIKKWLEKPTGGIGWTLLALAIGTIPVPIFLMHYGLLSSWQIWLPWIVLALMNPWIEEFYWRGFLLDNTEIWPGWASVFYTSVLFSANHAVFGVSSELFRGPEIYISTLIMGIVWAVVYKKTNSLRWIIFAHFLVDFFGLSAPSFLDLFKPGR